MLRLIGWLLVTVGSAVIEEGVRQWGKDADEDDDDDDDDDDDE